MPDYGLPWGVYPDYPTGAFDANPPVDQSNFYGLRDYDFEDIDSDVVSGEVRPSFRQWNDAAQPDTLQRYES